MAADLHIHVVTPKVTEEVLAQFFNHHLGSKYCFFTTGVDLEKGKSWDKIYGPGSAHDIIEKTPNIWIGEVSWLKAALFEDDESYVPNAVAVIHELIGEDLPVLSASSIGKILDALTAPNVTGYSTAGVPGVRKFLKRHRGKRVFTVSW